MSHYQIAPCTIADGAALARNNMSAYWEDPTWILLWRKGITLDYIIEQCAKRVPRNLLKDRATLRHQKAVDPQTGRLLGYARWVLPASHVTAPDAGPEWPEAQVLDVGAEERKEIDRVADTADWEPRSDMDALDVPVVQRRNEIMSRKPYLSLDYLAVHPENKGQGVATQLVESGMERAEKIGIGIFILAFKAGLGVYKRLGFTLVDQVIQDDSMYGGQGEYGAYFMVYEVSRSD